ncbi:hypothetical protein TBC1_111515 [Lentimicrobium saccharophilum]|uniref:Uncharacterized protein n=1 Tax=Lentimicrobium saccharophilum TaxID=1678841 RepID=A0A0S7BYQ0_9BACT|nr:hypothetical protein [Lentimicrobium saccharophilum]GAP43362.1 hypothetical protein TBC1_111515 [Lentimicrobium saccharophilum]
MKDTVKHITIRISKPELEVINEITANSDSLFELNQINENEYIITFDNIDNASELDELIKDKLIYQGFDRDYNPNRFGLICENLIDKFYNALE